MVDPCPLIAQPWWEWHPLVGTYIGVLGVLGVIVPWLFRPPEKMGRAEKALWTLVVFALFGLEIRTLYLDRDEHDAEQARERCQQLQSFQQIATTLGAAITTSQTQFDATMKRSDQIMKETMASNKTAKESLDNITGGDSYTYVAAEIGAGPPFQLSVWVHGKHGVHNVSAEIQQGFGGNPAAIQRQIQSVHGLSLGSGNFLPGITPISDRVGPGRYRIRVLTLNSDITELLDIAQCSNGQWNEAIQMGGPGAKENDKWKGIAGCHVPF
jgi:hypothetical protein